MMQRVLLIAALVVFALAATPRAEERPPASDERFEIKVTPEMQRHSRIRETLYFVSTAYGIGVLLLILFSGLSARMRDVAVRVGKKPFFAAMIFFALFSIAAGILEFPLSYYSGYHLNQEFDLSDQSFGAWMFDQLKELGVSIVIGSVIVALALVGIRKFRRWWLVLAIGSLPIILLGIVIYPLFIDPLFNKFEPLKDPVLRQRLLDTASKAGIEGSRVYQVDKSKQTKTLNAYVTGIGPSKRIVLWDTLLQKMNHDEIVAVMGHEMGHYVLHHMWKGLAFTVALAFLILFIAQKMVERGIARWGARWGVTAAHDPAAVPWLLLTIAIVSFFLSPVTSGYTRYGEHQADIFSLELTHLNEPMATAFIKLAETSKRDPNPPRFIEWWRYSHPAIGRRVPFALGYRPWEKGEPNRLWKGK